LTDQIGSTMANIVTDTAVNVVTNGGDLETAVIGSVLNETQLVSKTTNGIVDSLNIDTSTAAGKTLDTSLRTGVATSLMGGDGVKAATVTTMNNVLQPVVNKVTDFTPEVKADIAKILSVGLTAEAQGKNANAAINNALGELATEEIRNSITEVIDPVEELPMDTGEMLTEAVLPDKETLDKFRDQPDPLLEAQAEFEKIDAPPGALSTPLKSTYTPPDVPKEETAVGDVPKIKPEAPVGVPSEPKDTLPKITEKDLLDPIGDTYGVDVTPAETPNKSLLLSPRIFTSPPKELGNGVWLG